MAFIRLTWEGDPIYFNTDHILSFEDDNDGGTRLMCTHKLIDDEEDGGREICVNESPDTIMRRIKEAERK